MVPQTRTEGIGMNLVLQQMLQMGKPMDVWVSVILVN